MSLGGTGLGSCFGGGLLGGRLLLLLGVRIAAGFLLGRCLDWDLLGRGWLLGGSLLGCCHGLDELLFRLGVGAFLLDLGRGLGRCLAGDGLAGDGLDGGLLLDGFFFRGV